MDKIYNGTDVVINVSDFLSDYQKLLEVAKNPVNEPNKNDLTNIMIVSTFTWR